MSRDKKKEGRKTPFEKKEGGTASYPQEEGQLQKGEKERRAVPGHHRPRIKKKEKGSTIHGPIWAHRQKNDRSEGKRGKGETGQLPIVPAVKTGGGKERTFRHRQASVS